VSHRLQFSILETAFRVEVDAPLLAERLTAMTLSFPVRPTEDGPPLSYRVHERPPRVERRGEVAFEAEAADDLVPWLELDWYEQAIAACKGRWVLHAACVERGGKALILAGPSGSGKTTLAWALLAAGAGYLSDECAALGVNGAIGLSRPLSFVEGELPTRLPPGFSIGGYPFTRRDGEPAWAEHVRPPPERVVSGPLPLAALVRIRHAPKAEPGARRLSAAEALLGLWPLTLAPSSDALARAVAALRLTPAFELTTRDVAGAVSDLARLVPPQ
jgi:hypothetical protein